MTVNVPEIQQIGKSILVSPNLGRPSILSIDRKLKKKDIQTNLLFISDIADLDIFGKALDQKISLIPLYDYKWSYKLIFRKEKKGLFSKWREKRFRKKRKKFLEDKIKFIDDQDLSFEGLKTLKSRLHRGEPILAKVLNVESSSISQIHNITYLNGLNPQEFLIKNQVFGDMDNFYKVDIKFTLSKRVLNFLKERNFIMFDIYCHDDRINYHSIVVSKQKWEDFSFVHATDLHLAERNDRLYGIIKKWTKSSVKGGVEDFFKTVTKKLKLKKKHKDKKEEILSDIKIPLRKRLINPNNQFRQFIKLMNRKVFRNDLDFIVLTGDLVDYTILSRLSKKVRKVKDTFLFKYEESNWQVFKNCTLNLPPDETYKGVIRGEELNCPIFTTLGNHDYRPFHYDLTWGEMYKKIGLNASEAIALNELFSASPISALTKTSAALKGYLSEINSFYDFYVKLGNNLFIIMNTGSDSFKNLRDLLTGHPSVTGVSYKQIKYLENLLNNVIQEKMNTFLFLHGPPLNTGGKSLKINIFEKKGKRFVKKKISEFKESLVRSLGKPISSARIDGVFNMKYGCVSSNWEKLVEFCKDCCVLTLAGHTHDSMEFRLEDTEEKTSVYDAPPFKLRKIENPAAIYYDEYSEMYTNPKDIQDNGPFVVQTPALGLGRYGHPETAGGYREILIKNGKLASFKVKYIHR
ncbi:MAG: metallophosphoesterase [Candidatus Lokiarchaeota archaeon]|nr:metallophosphoesterase [Candidatus Lokiarchaeota archaeon]